MEALASKVLLDREESVNDFHVSWGNYSIRNCFNKELFPHVVLLRLAAFIVVM